MPSHGVDIIEGIPVVIKSGIMYAYHPSNPVPVRLGSYVADTKKAVWETSDAISNWLVSYRQDLVSRSRK